MALPTPPPYSQPIPNNPFYSDPSYYIQGATGPIILGSGLFVDYSTGVLSSSGGGGGAVNSILAGQGISVSSSTGNVTVTNTGVRGIVAGAGISVSSATGSVTISSLTAGTVTSVTAGTGLAGGTITSSGTISLPNTGVVSGSYTGANVTVDPQGRITAISNGSAVTSVTGTLPISVTAGATPVVSIAAATTANAGAVQLSDSTSSNLSTTAATSLAVKTAFDAAVAAIPKACVTGKGAIITGATASVPLALAVGADGLVLTADSACVSGLKWAAGGGGGSGTVTSITAGTGLSGGTITTSGTIALNPATTAIIGGVRPDGTTITVAGDGTITAVVGGTGTVTSITAGVGLTGGTISSSGTIALDTACVIPPSILSAKGSIIGASAASTPVALPVGTNGQVLSANSACTSGLEWISSSASGIPCACVTGKGALVTGTAAGIPSALTVGADGQVLVACSASLDGLCWAASTVPTATPTVFGTVYGKTNFANTLLGQGAGILIQSAVGCGITAVGFCSASLLSTPSNGVVAIGISALRDSVCSRSTTAVGDRAMCNAGSTLENVAVGTLALSEVTGSRNTAMGTLSGYSLTAGESNVFIGSNTACANTSGDRNVVVGPDVTTSSATSSCELAIGFSATDTWLTGDSTKAIKPGAGIKDCAASTGTAGQVLMSNGANAICWGSAGGGGSDATPTVAGVVKGCYTADSTALGCNALLTSSGGFCSVAIGANALRLSTSAGNVAVGYRALCLINSGQENVAVGFNALCALTTGTYNVSIGSWSGRCSTSGDSNVLIGHDVQKPTPTDSCVLTIGFGPGATQVWLKGSSDQSVQFGRSLKDFFGSKGTDGEVLMSSSLLPFWTKISSINAAPNYGYFLSEVDQSPTSVNVGKAVTLETTVVSVNSSIAGTSSIVADVDGVYELQITAQLQSTSATGFVEIWVVVNGTPNLGSNTKISVPTANQPELLTKNYVLSLLSGDTVQFFWASNSLNMRLKTLASTMGGPSIPSVSVTMVPVGA